jgi:hypothetical protein
MFGCNGLSMGSNFVSRRPEKQTNKQQIEKNITAVYNYTALFA